MTFCFFNDLAKAETSCCHSTEVQNQAEVQLTSGFLPHLSNTKSPPQRHRQQDSEQSSSFTSSVFQCYLGFCSGLATANSNSCTSSAWGSWQTGFSPEGAEQRKSVLQWQQCVDRSSQGHLQLLQGSSCHHKQVHLQQPISFILLSPCYSEAPQNVKIRSGIINELTFIETCLNSLSL